MERLTADQINRLKYDEDFCTCDVCGESVDSFENGKGQYVLCEAHNSWFGWFKAWRSDR